MCVCVSVCPLFFSGVAVGTKSKILTLIISCRCKNKVLVVLPWMTYLRQRKFIHPMLKAWQVFWPYILKTMRDTVLVCIADIYEKKLDG